MKHLLWKVFQVIYRFKIQKCLFICSFVFLYSLIQYFHIVICESNCIEMCSTLHSIFQYYACAYNFQRAVSPQEGKVQDLHSRQGSVCTERSPRFEVGLSWCTPWGYSWHLVLFLMENRITKRLTANQQPVKKKKKKKD